MSKIIAFLPIEIDTSTPRGKINQSQNFFSAAQNQTVTKFLHQKGIPCVQLEINANYISAEKGGLFAQKTAQLLQGSMHFVVL